MCSTHEVLKILAATDFQEDPGVHVPKQAQRLWFVVAEAVRRFGDLRACSSDPQTEASCHSDCETKLEEAIKQIPNAKFIKPET